MIEKKTIIQRFKLWLAALIGGSTFIYEVQSTKDANEGWRRSNAELEAKIEEYKEALIWCSGSADFSEGGQAREGWLKVRARLL